MIENINIEESTVYAGLHAFMYDYLWGYNGVFDYGSKLACTIVSNNNVRIGDGLLINQGRFMRVLGYENLTIENGTSGQNRKDLIVAHFETDGVTETHDIRVIQGETGTNAVAPTPIKGDTLNGATVNELALYVVNVEGLTIKSIEPQFELLKSVKDLKVDIEAKDKALDERIEYIENNGVSVGDTLPIETQIFFDGDESELPYGYERVEAPFSNPNLLINGDFKINQRGGTVYPNSNTWKYSVDRWRYIGIMTVTANSDGTVTIAKENNAESTYFTQSLETPNYYGNYTFSFEVGEINGALGIYIEGGSAEILEVTKSGVYEIHSTTGGIGIVFRLDGETTSAVLKWAKLEYGKLATPFVPRLYGEELALCQRFFTRLKTTYPMLVTQVANADTKTYMYIPTPQSIRQAPNVNFVNVKLLKNGVGGEWFDVTNVTCVGFSMMGVTLQLDKETNYEVGVPYYLILPNSGYIQLDAEIY